MNTIDKKITKATFKSFVRKNKKNLFILVKSTFDDMTDCVTSTKDIPRKAETTTEFLNNSLGIKGIWLVGGSRNFFKKYEDDIFLGIEVSNCCGNFIVASIK